MLFMITYATSLEALCIIYPPCALGRVVAYIMCMNLYSLGLGPCPFLHLSEKLSYCPLGAYLTLCERARE